jgi:hypothetical protein
MTPIRRHAVMLAATAVAILAPASAATAAAASPATAAAPAASPAPACLPWTSVQPSTPGASNNVLASVAVLSPGNVWAAGSYYDISASQTRTLIEHWNGSSWTQLPTPSPSSTNSFLTGIAAVSADDIWAVGYYSDDVSDVQQTLILHWNGTAWTQVASPDLGGSSRYNVLSGVTVISATKAWAVGVANPTGSQQQSLVLHWNGTAWKPYKSPDPSSSINFLNSVSGTSARNVWAAGYLSGAAASQTLVLHWNGTAWEHIASPDPSGPAEFNVINGIAASSARRAWAAGYYLNAAGDLKVLVLRWNGTAWRRAASPRRSGTLTGVTAVSARDAWAVGYYWDGSANQTLIEHWNGTRWRHILSPNPGDPANENELDGVAASSAADLWAVGEYTPFNNSVNQTMALHRC